MNQATAEKSVRQQQIEARRNRVASVIPKIPRVRVVPASDDVRKYIKHPSGLKFPESGAAEWPLDSFTRRRLRDGSVTREEQKEPEQQSAARPHRARRDE